MNDMSDLETRTDLQDVTVALFLQENDPDQLTDILVEALDEALRLLQEEVGRETLH